MKMMNVVGTFKKKQTFQCIYLKMFDQYREWYSQTGPRHFKTFRYMT